MPRSRRRLRLPCAVGIVTLAAAGTVAPARAAGLRNVRCHTVAASPSFASDRVVFCASGSGRYGFESPINLYRSADAGRTWSGPFVVSDNGGEDIVGAIYLSPNYASDRTVFVATGGGGYVSVDDGRTFLPLGTGPEFGQPYSSVFLEGAPNGTGTRTSVIIPVGTSLTTQCCTYVHDSWAPPVGRPVKPPVDAPYDSHYFVPPDFPTARRAVVLTARSLPGAPAGRNRRLVTYDCDGQFVCIQPRYEFPVAPGTTSTFLEYTENTYVGSPDNYLVTIDDVRADYPARQVFRSRDHGRTWSRWDSVTRLLRGHPSTTGAYVTAAPDAPRRLFLRVSGQRFTTERTPQEQLFRSDDDGRTWRRIGHAWGPTQRARGRSTLPWNSLPLAYQPAVAAPGGHLYVIGERRHGGHDFRHAQYLGLYCSRDAGRTWTRGCS